MVPADLFELRQKVKKEMDDEFELEEDQTNVFLDRKVQRKIETKLKYENKAQVKRAIVPKLPASETMKDILPPYNNEATTREETFPLEKCLCILECFLIYQF